MMCLICFEAMHAFLYSPAMMKLVSSNKAASKLSTTSSSSSRLHLTKTEEIFQQIAQRHQQDQSEGAGGISSYQGLQALEKAWIALKNGSWKQPSKAIVFESDSTLEHIQTSKHYDVIVCGGTLGIFYAYALQLRGYKVAVVERGKVQGRVQEWNISKKELETLLSMQILTSDELKEIVAIEFNPVRVGFKTNTAEFGNPSEDPAYILQSAADIASPVVSKQTSDGYEVFLKDILNLGIRPKLLIEIVKNKFLQSGGVLFEDSLVNQINVHPNAAQIAFQRPGQSQQEDITSRLVIDCMGNASPISRQIRGTKAPDGICIVVGSCAKGFDVNNNTYSDVIYTDNPIMQRGQGSYMQYFWEAFPTGGAKDERTTYLFTYLDADPARPSILNEIMEDYWTLLPRYQGVDVDKLTFERVLYGMFPTYRASPLQSPFARLLAVGDASGIQSPLSFGGFGGMTRHLKRITNSVDDALSMLDDELLTTEALRRINAYLPSLSVAWMFQRAMSIRVKKRSTATPPLPLNQIVNTLAGSFSSMESLGDAVLRPFLQDVIMFGPLLKTLSLAFLKDPLITAKILPQVGLYPLLDFLFNFIMLGWYTILHRYYAPVLTVALEKLPVSQERRFRWKRQMEAWKFGSGLDYYDH